MTPNADYVRQLEDACLVVWAELPAEVSTEIRAEYPRLMDFLAHLHHSIEHEQAMVRQNIWASYAASEHRPVATLQQPQALYCLFDGEDWPCKGWTAEQSGRYNLPQNDGSGTQMDSSGAAS